jgi:two-component system chemotaxis response regulator CheY
MSAEGSRVLDVGNCDPDHATIRRLLSRFDADVDRVMFVDEALAALKESRYDLVLVNRVIFADGSDGLTLIERMKANDGLGDVPVMMISNYSDAQDRAVAAGAVRGFGKAELTDPRTVEMLAPYVSEENVR